MRTAEDATVSVVKPRRGGDSVRAAWRQLAGLPAELDQVLQLELAEPAEL